MTTPRSLPKSVQLTEMLIREIAAGRIEDGARLPSERQMSADLGVAVGTLRKALAALQDKGLLERVQGSGNYVRAKKVSSIDSVYAFFRLELTEGGGLPTTKILEVYKRRKPCDAPNFGDATSAHRFRRIRFLNETPVALEEIWLDARFADRIRLFDVTDALYVFYKQSLGLVISRIEDKVGVCSLPDWHEDALLMKDDGQAGFIERIGWDQYGKPAEYSRTWFNPQIARYTMRL